MNARSTTPSLAPVLAVNFVGALGFSIVLPFLVFLVARWGGNALVYGLVGATYSAFQLVGAPVLGRWSDVHGRRRILLLSQLGTLASWVLFVTAFAVPERPIWEVDSSVVGRFAVTLPLVLVFVARAFDGLTGGNISVANAYLADITTEEDRSVNFGKMGISANLGFIVGPAIAGLLGGIGGGELLPVLAALGISIVATMIIAFKLPESNPCVLTSDPERAGAQRVLRPDHKACFTVESVRPSLASVLRTPCIPVLLAIHFLVMLGFNFFYIAFPVYAAEGLAWSVRDTGLFFSALSFCLVIVQGPLLGFVSRFWRDGILIVVGSLILAASFPFFASTRSPVIYAGAVLLALGNGLMWPSVVASLSKAAGSEIQGAVQGLASSGGAVASILGLVVGGVLFGTLEARVFFVAAAVIFAAFLLSIRVTFWERGQS